ncbi:LD-carboxypeptidase, partial [Desulfovibrio sp. OttesenSCG-928-A18]|nr:LD-carboxypeptidase [Desulfovibrio sp. OttesenSCG-928-A18]
AETRENPMPHEHENIPPMTEKPPSIMPRIRVCVFILVLPLLIAGCSARQNTAPSARAPVLIGDQSFLADLRQAREIRGGGIAIVAPSSGMGEERTRQARAAAQAIGAVFPENAMAPGLVPYTANSDAVRLKLLAEALADPDTAIIWAARGGYGSSRLLEGLTLLPPPPRPKILIGYSDVTFLHLYWQKQGWRTVHGAMFGEMSNPAKDENNFRILAALLAGRLRELRYEGIAPCNDAAWELSRPVRAPLTGGNLTCIAAAAGTPWALDARGKILFLEDVKEPGYKIDRMLTQLRAAGLLAGVEAILLGGFTSGDEHSAYALQRFAGDCGIPVFASEQFGHGASNLPLIFNADASLEPGSGKAFTLRIRADKLP